MISVVDLNGCVYKRKLFLRRNQKVFLKRHSEEELKGILGYTERRCGFPQDFMVIQEQVFFDCRCWELN